MIAEDQSLVRDSFVTVLSMKEPRFRFVFEATNGKEAVQFLKAGFAPDILITDIEMPEMNGVKLIKYVKENHPNIKIIVISMYGSDYIISECIKLGADAFFHKNAAMEDVSDALIQLKENKYVHPPEVAATIAKIEKLNVKSDWSASNLSEREEEIIPYLCHGKTNKEIGELLNIGEETVKTHRKNIMHKTRSETLADLFKYAIKRGIINPFDE